MKKLTLILVALIGLLAVSPAMGYTEPVQGTDNATDIILWYGDNITIESANVTIPSANITIPLANVTILGLEDSLTAASEAGAQVIADEYESIWGDLLLFLLAVAITALAFWQKNAFLYLMACPVNLVYGLSLASGATVASTQWVMGVIIAIIGMFCLFRVVVNELIKRGKG